MSNYFPSHTHSCVSILDGMGSVEELVKTTAGFGQPAIALSDHGTMGGTVQLYTEAKKAGLLPFPAVEWYVVQDVTDPDTKGKRWHMGMMALDFTGYQAMVKLQTLSWKPDHFYYKPLIDFADLAFFHEQGLSRHVAVYTGCYSGMVVNEWKANDQQDHARRMMKKLRGWFPNLYVELQNHNIEWSDTLHDLDIVQTLYELATELGLPVVLGNDSHYSKPEHAKAHKLMKKIGYHIVGDDVGFSGEGYHLMSSAEMMAKIPKYMHNDVELGFKTLLDSHKLALPALDNYKFRVPKLASGDPDVVLRAEVEAKTKELGLDKLPDYVERIEHELHVIKEMKMSNYFLLVKRYITDWCRENDVVVNTRGSANGSLICYAFGITAVDPIKWGLSFERFLSLDRLRPPDIDVDVSFRARDRLVQHMRKVFPTISQIGTWSEMGMTTNADGEQVGSVMVQYHSAMHVAAKKLNKQARADAEAKKVKYNLADDIFYDEKVFPEDREALHELSKLTVYKSMGTHPAGFVLPGDGLAIEDYLPQSRIIGSNTTVTQYPMKDVEALGYVKIDVLGLKALETLNGCLKLLGKPSNQWDWIPDDDEQTCNLLRSGRTVGLFQYEGFSSSRGGREMKIGSTHDTIIGLALYRPALINGGQKDLFLHNRESSPAKQVKLHSLFDDILTSTAGVPVFQEQIMEMLKVIGMQFDEYNELMTAIKASNGNIHGAKETFERMSALFLKLCLDCGLTSEDADRAWGAVVGYTEYGFNRAHATSYGLMSYRSAYLKTHYPLEYMSSLMDVWGDDKKKSATYRAELRRIGIGMARVDVNRSDLGWAIDTLHDNALRKGLVDIDGVSDNVANVILAERNTNGPFTSVQDFIDRTPRRPVTGGKDYAKHGTLVGVCKALMDAGAFTSLLPEDQR